MMDPEVKIYAKKPSTLVGEVTVPTPVSQAWKYLTNKARWKGWWGQNLYLKEWKQGSKARFDLGRSSGEWTISRFVPEKAIVLSAEHKGFPTSLILKFTLSAQGPDSTHVKIERVSLTGMMFHSEEENMERRLLKLRSNLGKARKKSSEK